LHKSHSPSFHVSDGSSVQISSAGIVVSSATLDVVIAGFVAF